MARLIYLLFLSLPLVIANAAARASGRTQYAPRNIPHPWKNIGDAPANKPLTFDLIFAPRDAAGLEERMLGIARSQSAWMSEEEIAAYIAPSPEVKATVEAAIKKLGATNVKSSRNGGTLTVTTTVATAAKFFDAHFFEYTHPQATESQYKTHKYTIPPSIGAYISDISPFATFTHVARPSRRVQRAELSDSVTSSCNASAVTPACIRSLYGFDTYTPIKSNGTARLGIMGFIGENFNQIDLKTYLEKFRPEASSYTIPVTIIDGATNTDSDPTREACLDTQTAAGIIYPLPSRYYDLATEFVPGDIFLLTFQYFLGMPVDERPSVITISYATVESYIPLSQASTMCTAAQQLTAAGMTIVVASGDWGVGSPGGETCPPFHPTYPCGCPYILSVGSTQKFSPEVMVDKSLAGFYSSAGFSNHFPTPSYQRSVVLEYQRGLGQTNIGYYNKTRRVFPDVSAQGSLQPVVVANVTYRVGGTSASAPIVASGITLLNDLLITAGKATVGWANPTFYAHPEAFTDITSGGSYGCGSGSGFPAKHGWDAASGLGTPLFSKLRAVYGV